MLTDLQNGRQRYRRNFTAVPIDFDAKWTMTDEQAQRFFSFYQNDIKDGTEWFLLPVIQPMGFQHLKARFKDSYKYSLVGAPMPKSDTGRMWEITANMQIFLRPEYPKPKMCDMVAFWGEKEW